MIIQSMPYPKPRSIEIDEQRWKGIPENVDFDPARLKRLSTAIDQALADLERLNASNSEKAQARALLIAMAALKDAPEPPSEIIWKLIERGLAIYGVCEAFYLIVETVLG